jgi:hypothetical protein
MRQTYFYDLIKQTEVQRNVDIDYDRSELLKFLEKDTAPFEKVKKAFDHSIALGLKRQDEHQRNELLEQAIQNSLGKHPEGTIITKEVVQETVDEIMNLITPYLFRKFRKR